MHRKKDTHAQTFADGTGRANRLIGQHSQSARTAVGITRSSGQRLENALICISEVELVLPIVIEKKTVGGSQFFVMHFVGRHAVLDRQRTAHQHGRAITDEAGDDFIRKGRSPICSRAALTLLQRSRAESMRVPSRSNTRSLMDSTGMGRSTRIISPV